MKKQNDKTVEYHGLCHRCEHRVRFIESKGVHRPRCECGDTQNTKISCYMYMPVRPVTLSPDKSDPRPFILNYFSSRGYGVRVEENLTPLLIQVNKNEYVPLLMLPRPIQSKKRRDAKNGKK